MFEKVDLTSSKSHDGQRISVREGGNDNNKLTQVNGKQKLLCKDFFH